MSRNRKKCIWGISYLSIFSVISLVFHALLGRFSFLSFLYEFLPEVKSTNQSWSLIVIVLVYIWLLCFLFHFKKEKDVFLLGIILWLSGVAGAVVLSLYPLTMDVAYDSGVILGESLAIGALITFVLFILLLPAYIISLRSKDATGVFEGKDDEADKEEIIPDKENDKHNDSLPVIKQKASEEKLDPGIYLINKEGDLKYKMKEQKSSFGWVEYVVNESIKSGEYSIVKVSAKGNERIPYSGFNHGYTLEGIGDRVITIKDSLRIWNEVEKRSFNYVNSESILTFSNEEEINLDVFVRFYGDDGKQNGYRWCVIYVK